MHYLIFSILFAMTSISHAAMVRFDLLLTIDSIEAPYGCGGQSNSFGCFSIGDSVSGQISVPEEVLANDGLITTLPSFNFDLDFGSRHFSTGPGNNALSGFRNRFGLQADPMAGPSVMVSNGAIVELMRGVYGEGDFPLVDFFGPRFAAFDGTIIRGTVEIVRRVPEPTSLWLALLGGVAALGSVAGERSRTTAKVRISPP